MYFPFADQEDRRKVRRWLRNSIELLSIQKCLKNVIATTTTANTFDQLRKEHWIQILKRGILPPTINYLFSLWDYTNVHTKDYPFKKEAWRIRYQNLLKALDRNDSIRTANEQVMAQLEETVKEASEASTTTGKWLKSLLDVVIKRIP
jgi:hypothetical protein